MNTIIEFLWQIYLLINDWIKNADTKAEISLNDLAVKIGLPRTTEYIKTRTFGDLTWNLNVLQLAYNLKYKEIEDLIMRALKNN